VEIYTLNKVAGASEMLLAIFAGTFCQYLEDLWSSTPYCENLVSDKWVTNW
jgi:hypothetical protein